MTLFIDNLLFSLRGSSIATDLKGNKKYEIKGKFFSFSRRKYVLDANGKCLYLVRNKYFNFLSRQAIVYDGTGKKLLRLVKAPLSFGPKFYTKDYPDELYFDGEFCGFNYTVSRNGKKVASVYKPLNLLRDKFQLDIAESEDPAFFVALIIAIDNILDVPLL